MSGTALWTAGVSAQEAEEGRTSAGCDLWSLLCPEMLRSRTWSVLGQQPLTGFSDNFLITLDVFCYFQVHLINCTSNPRLVSQRLSPNELLVLWYLWHCLWSVTLSPCSALSHFSSSIWRWASRAQALGCVQCRWDSAAPSQALGRIHPAVLQ